MKRIKAIPLLALLAVLIMGTLAACGGGAASGSASSAAAEPTIDDLKAKMAEVAAAEYDNVTMNAVIGAEIAASGMNMNMDVTVDGEIDKASDPIRSHMIMKMNALGEETTNEMYTVGDEVITVDEDGTATKSSSAEGGSSVTAVTDMVMAEEQINKFIDAASDWTMVEQDGKTVVTLTLPPEALAALDTDDQLSSLLGGMDGQLGDVVVNYTVGADNLVENANINMTMSSGAASDASASAESAAASDASASADAADATSFDFTATINIDVNLSNYNKTTVPEAPAVS